MDLQPNGSNTQQTVGVRAPDSRPYHSLQARTSGCKLIAAIPRPLHHGA
jgi:hypothetical protein